MKYFCYDNMAVEAPEIRSGLGEAIGVSDEMILAKLTAGLDDATKIQLEVGVMHAPSKIITGIVKDAEGNPKEKTRLMPVSRTKYKSTLNSIRGALIKIRDKKGSHDNNLKKILLQYAELPEMTVRYIDTYFDSGGEYLTDGMFPKVRFQSACISLSRENSFKAEPLISIFDALIGELEEIIRDKKEEGKNPKAKRYIGGIACLAQNFKDALPKEKIICFIPWTDPPEPSIFHKIVIFWLAEFGLELKDASRHIKYSIDRFNILP